MKVKVRRLFRLFLFVFLLSACGQTQDGKGKDKLTLMLDWYPNAVHSFIYVAQEKGYFDEAGLDVEIEMPSDANDPLRLAAAGKVDVAINYQSQLIMSQDEGVPVKGIASIVQQPLSELMVKNDASIQSPKDLEGKTVGVGTSMVPQALVQALVKADGGNPDKVNFIDVGYDLVPALATDRVDALMGAYINHEKLLLEDEGYDIKTLPRADYGLPSEMEMLFVSGDQTIAKKRDLLQRFIDAVQKGQQAVVQDPKAGLKTLLEQQNKDNALNPEIEKRSLALLLPLMGDEQTPFGSQKEAQYQALIDWMYQAGIIQQNMAAKDVYIDLGGQK